MTTAAAIDRTVHHAIILEMTGPSIRSEQAIERLQAFDAVESATGSLEA